MFRHLATLLCLGFPLVCHAQKASIFGKLAAPQGIDVAGSTIFLIGTTLGTHCDTQGNYRIDNINPGTYTLVFSHVTFQRDSLVIHLQPGQTLQIDRKLVPDPTKSLNEVIIVGQSQAQLLRESAKAVEVVEMKQAKFKAGDLAEVIAQTKGVSIRRSGGLGSDARFSLNGLTDDQIRFFVDGVPLGYTGYVYGFSNIPVNLVDRVELYKGVVPISFGADALGGAMNIVTPALRAGWHGSASYQAGSFRTHRLSAALQYKNDSTGFFVGLNSFFDYAKNNYPIDVLLVNDLGQQTKATVTRFHDAYQASGVNLTLGVQNKSWAQKLALTVFYSDYYKEQQSDYLMLKPYGDAASTTRTYGTSLTYQQAIAKKTNLQGLAGYTYALYHSVDTTTAIYNWKGEIIGRRLNSSAGEIDKASDNSQWENTFFARVSLEHYLSDNHVLRATIAPNSNTRQGDEKRQLNASDPDPLNLQQVLQSSVNGIEYEANLAGRKIQNILFAKQYLQKLTHQNYQGSQIFSNSSSIVNYGAGDGLRILLPSTFQLKATYEYATRLPSSNEIFGNGRFSLPNYSLKPEQSHNANLELSWSQRKASTFTVSLTGFTRAINNLIAVVAATNVNFSYSNIAQATSTGAEVAASWDSPGDRLALSGNATWIDFRNRSTGGDYKTTNGDRIPNRPYSMANAGLQYNIGQLRNQKDRLSLFWNARFVYQFYTGWESLGIQEEKTPVPSQFVNNAGLIYKLPIKTTTVSMTAEGQNLANAKVYDNFGVQKPGRAFYLKLTGQF